jgi:hypothetical protein
MRTPTPSPSAPAPVVPAPEIRGPAVEPSPGGSSSRADEVRDRPLTGAVLAGRYELRALLGRGGMGEVYEAADPVLDRTVAVKVLRQDLAADGRSGARFEREARTAARLSHPRIVAVYDAGRHDGRVFIVMEHVAGSTLVDALRRHGRLGTATAASIGADVAEALAHAHERGVVHRDVTPGNVMLDRDGRAKVLDFGIARAARGSAAPSSTSVHGTVAYAAPEVLAGAHGDQRVDVYGLGALLYELVTGAPPFRGDDAEVARRLHVRRPVPVRGWIADVPEELDVLVQRLLSYEPADRPENLAAVARTLREIAASPTAAVTAPLVVAPGDAGRASPTTPAMIPPTRRLSDDGAPPPDAAATPRRWPARLGRAAAWLALLASFAGAGSIIVPTLVGVAQPVTAQPTAPLELPAPTDVQVVASCDGWLSTGADVSWSSVTGASAYELWRRGTAGDGFELVATLAPDVTAVRDIDLGIDTTYTYRVRGLDGPAPGAWSRSATVATPLFCFT